MKTVACSCIAAILFAAAACRQDAADERKFLQGTWLPTAAELSENPFDEATLKMMKLVVEGDKYTVTVGNSVDKGTTRIDPAAEPKTMDIMGTDGPNKGKTFLAIYELNDDTLREGRIALPGHLQADEILTARRPNSTGADQKIKRRTRLVCLAVED